MRPSRPLLVAVGVAGAALGLVTGALVLTSAHADQQAPTVLVGLLVGWSFVGVGLFAWRRRPDNRVGVLMVAVGYAWFTGGLWLTDVAALHTAGLALGGLVYAVLAHLLLAFPSSRVGRGVERTVLAFGYAVAVGLQVATVVFLDTSAVAGCECPPNLLLVRRDDVVARSLLTAGQLAGAGLTLAVVVVVVRRWRATGPPRRRAEAPVLACGAVAIALFGLQLAAGAADLRDPLASALLLAALAALAALPYAFLAGLARTRFFRAGAVAAVVARLGQEGEDRLAEAVAEGLGDDTAELAYWLPERGRYGDRSGRPVRLPAEGSGRAWTEIDRDGRRIGAIVHDPALLEEPELIEGVAAAAALALDNERLGVELRARVDELERSRAQVVRAGDAERRRLERDLHDGAQQRLVALRLALGLLGEHVDGGPGRRLLDGARVELDGALAELRELARGLHPAVLTSRGLVGAVRSLAARAPVPVQVDTRGLPDAGLPEGVEASAYFVVAEGLTNLAKHAAATRAWVLLACEEDRLVVEVADDGRGGADASGLGLSGLAARVAALDGRLLVEGRADGGTIVRAELPVRGGRPA